MNTKKWIGFVLSISALLLFSQGSAAEKDGDDVRERISSLKEQLANDPESEGLTLALVNAYLEDGNTLWALRTALSYPGEESCEMMSWIAWLHFRQGALDEAREALFTGSCWETPPHTARRELLLALIEQQAENETGARAHLKAAHGEKHAFAEDREAIARLVSRDPGFLPPLSGRLELGLGFTSNALAGSPTDSAATKTDNESPMGQTSTWLRFVAPMGRWVRPAVEVDARAHGFTTESGRDLSYGLFGVRPGLFVGWLPSALLAYRYEGLLLAGGDLYDSGPLWFYDAHRFELEAQLLTSLTVFGGAGRRNFREIGRSRAEVDGGVGGSFELGSRTRIMGALTGRWHGADKAPYDLRGASVLLNAEVRLPASWSTRAGIVAGLDAYHRSAGYFDAASPELTRRDVLLKLSAGVSSPSLAQGLKVGLFYEFSHRDSTIQIYEYVDHRVLAKLQWSFSFDPWLPSAVAAPDHIPIDYGLGSTALEERIQDLLRQDEAAQRSSSCVK
jgi:hypothetical protein